MSMETMSMLFASQSQSSNSATPPSNDPSDPLNDLFSLIDANGDGKVTKSDFENTLGAGGKNLAQADDVFSKFDGNGDGSVSLDEMVSALTGAGGHHHSANTNKASDFEPFTPMRDSSTSANAPDEFTATSKKFADLSKGATTPATAFSAATSSYSLIEQIIKMETNAISAHSSVSVST